MVHRARGNAWCVSFQPRNIPRTHLLPSTSTAMAEHHHLPSIPQWPVPYTAATAILLTFKSHHITCLCKTTNGSHLTRSRSQGHHSGPRPHKINLPTCHSLSLLFFPISLPSDHTPLLLFPKHVSHISASGPLHVLCPLLECPSPRCLKKFFFN